MAAREGWLEGEGKVGSARGLNWGPPWGDARLTSAGATSDIVVCGEDNAAHKAGGVRANEAHSTS
jgi:hypothetical protein